MYEHYNKYEQNKTCNTSKPSTGLCIIFIYKMIYKNRNLTQYIDQCMVKLI